jgi:Tol biopolymer transport system component
MDADGSNFVWLSGSHEDCRNPVWSPDGSRLIFYSDDSTIVIRADGQERHQLPKAYSYAWSPDASRAAFVTFTSGKLYIVKADGSGVVTVDMDTEAGGIVAWSPDSNRIILSGGQGYQSVGLDGSGPLQVLPTGHHAALSPDGTKMVYGSTYDVAEVRTPAVRSLATGQETILDDGAVPFDPESYFYPLFVWSPQSDYVVYTEVAPDDESTWIRLMAKADGSERRQVPSWYPLWQQDGTVQFANPTAEGIEIRALDGTLVRTIPCEASRPYSRSYVEYMVWSPIQGGS